MDEYKNREIYRKTINTNDLVFYRVSYMETDLYVGTEKNYKDLIYSNLVNTRRIIDEHIENNPLFLKSLSPIGYNENTPNIAIKMCKASKKADVGPMATVAAAFCMSAYDAVSGFSKEIIIENGGDLLLKTNKNRTIALYAGKSKLSMKLGLKIKPQNKALGICTSAGTIGHSKSFGVADLALVVSDDVLLADALATKLGNMVKSKEDIKEAVEKIIDIDCVKGAIAIMDENIALVGDLEILPL